MSLKLISSPAGVLTVPFGVVEVCHAGTSLTQPQSKLIVPPRFGSRTSTPSAPISPRAPRSPVTGAPVRLAIATLSPMWSPWPWVSRIASASTSAARDRRLRVAGQERVDQHGRVRRPTVRTPRVRETARPFRVTPPSCVRFAVPSDSSPAAAILARARARTRPLRRRASTRRVSSAINDLSDPQSLLRHPRAPPLPAAPRRARCRTSRRRRSRSRSTAAVRAAARVTDPAPVAAARDR